MLTQQYIIFFILLTSADPERKLTKRWWAERTLWAETRDRKRWNSEMVASRDMGGRRGGTIRSGHASWRAEYSHWKSPCERCTSSKEEGRDGRLDWREGERLEFNLVIYRLYIIVI